MSKVDILGSQISVWSLDETVLKMKELVESGTKHYICVSNVHTVVMGHQDRAFADVTNAATLATADGVPLLWAAKALGGPEIHGRASGPDILAEMLKSKECAKIRHYFYGSTPAVLESLQKQIRAMFPNAIIAGAMSPPIRPAKKPGAPLDAGEMEDCEKIDASKAEVVWVGLGAPKQEVWMYRARPFLKAPVLIGIGAAFDFIAGNKKRAPMWMQKTGLEWFYRLSQEPKRLVGRYFKTNPVFVAEVAKQALALRLNGKDAKTQHEPHKQN